jgi:hypothetical protein
MSAADYVPEAIAIGIGPQTGLGAVNTDVRDATNLIDTVASASGATGILLRADSDLSLAFERIESDGGRSPGTLSRLSGTLSRVEPTISFVIDAMGNRLSPATPAAGEFNASEYMLQLLEGTRFVQDPVPAADATGYFFDTSTSFKTMKIWRGINAPAADEAWVLEDCTFNMTWNFTAGEKATITVDVFANAVTFQPGTTYPTAPDYGTQTGAAPILQTANASLDSQERGFVTASLAITYPAAQVPDSNVTGGITNVIGQPRTVEFQASWYVEKDEHDYPLLETDADVTIVPLSFHLGQPAVAAGIINAWDFDIANLRVTNQTKEDSDALRVLRSITGYAVVSGGGTDNQELILSAV